MTVASDALPLKHRLYLGLVRLLTRLPLGVLQMLGGWVGRFVYWKSASYRRHFDANLKQAIGAAEAARNRQQAQAEAGKAGKHAVHGVSSGRGRRKVYRMAT